MYGGPRTAANHYCRVGRSPQPVSLSSSIIYDLPQLLLHGSVKAVETLEIDVPGSGFESKGPHLSTTTIVCTISSDGKIFVYDLAALSPKAEERLQLQPVAEYDTKGTRLTCLTVAGGKSVSANTAGEKRRRDGGTEGEERGEKSDEETGAEDR